MKRKTHHRYVWMFWIFLLGILKIRSSFEVQDIQESRANSPVNLKPVPFRHLKKNESPFLPTSVSCLADLQGLQ